MPPKVDFKIVSYTSLVSPYIYFIIVPRVRSDRDNQKLNFGKILIYFGVMGLEAHALSARALFASAVRRYLSLLLTRYSWNLAVSFIDSYGSQEL